MQTFAQNGKNVFNVFGFPTVDRASLIFCFIFNMVLKYIWLKRRAIIFPFSYFLVQSALCRSQAEMRQISFQNSPTQFIDLKMT